ncbi:hypothetical protein LEP1GSC161_2183 [Leptospira santarosai str. CBC1416]|uniref:Uncharacterized protein n=1 Tax=Leptospira santarosai str. CBC1416 TaxID=1193059 RepID=M6VT25_9LEPT|nr:hypothetical protein LEP1GSC161_2183 [Leptospira santarosai str. CBC1416]
MFLRKYVRWRIEEISYSEIRVVLEYRSKVYLQKKNRSPHRNKIYS